MEQIAFSFDKATIKKILIGALIASGAPAIIGLLGFIGTLQFSNPNITMFVAWACPVLINIVREFIKGQ